MSRFQIHSTKLADLFFLTRKRLEDSRGFLERLFCIEDLSPLLGGCQIHQINLTGTALRGTIRGIHFRHAPHDEFKLVTCLRGSVWDVGVDLRPESSTYLKWFGLELSEANNRTIVLPPGFGHGYQSLKDDCQLVYFHTGIYQAEAEDGISISDPVLGINWPLPVHSLSERDLSYPPLTPERIRALR
jgi:dTDP-4-dehydrorhamnose 3,5-epimerase